MPLSEAEREPEALRGPAVFLDRDGVLIEDSVDYIRRVDQVRLLDGAAGAVRALNEEGIPVVVVTNQSAVARGYLSLDDLEAINNRMLQLLESAGGARITRLYFCPYHPDGVVAEYARPSDMRKPAPGMLLQAAREIGIDLRRSFMVGDKESDMIAAKRAGCAAIAVLTGPTSHGWKNWNEGRPDWVAPNLDAAVSQIVARLRAPAR